MNVEKCALKSLAAFALICGFALAARAQLGTGWSSAPETYVVQTSSGCTAVANSSGGGTFTVPSGINRAEFRYGNLPTTTTNQFQGDVVYNSLGGNRVNCKQTFGPDPSTPWEMLAFDKTLVVGSNPPGAFYDVEWKPLPQPGLYPYTVGTTARVNTIFDPSAKTVDVYINGSHIIQDTGHSGPNYNKIGAYVTGTGTGPAQVTWTNIQFWSGGKAPTSGGTNFTLTASAGANGSISPSGNVTVPQGGSQLFTITPNSGFAVSSVTVDGTSQGAVSSYTFTNVQASHTISAAFQPTSNTFPQRRHRRLDQPQWHRSGGAGRQPVLLDCGQRRLRRRQRDGRRCEPGCNYRLYFLQCASQPHCQRRLPAD
ncbi:MAG: Ig-like domain-containing protein [Opitutaceae bacterium]